MAAFFINARAKHLPLLPLAILIEADRDLLLHRIDPLDDPDIAVEPVLVRRTARSETKAIAVRKVAPPHHLSNRVQITTETGAKLKNFGESSQITP